MIVKIIYAVIILVFAIIGMTLLLDIHPLQLPRGRRSLYVVSMLLMVVESVVMILWLGKSFVALYPLLVHLPLVVIFCVVSRRGTIKVLFALLTMIFLSYPPALVNLLLVRWFSIKAQPELLMVVLSCIFILLLLLKFMQKDFSYVMQQLSASETAQFCLVPIGYNILIYTIGKYNYDATSEPMRLILFICALGVYSLLLRIFRRTREVEEMQKEQAALNLQMEAAKGQLNALRASQEQSLLYRHDMRHHLSLIDSFLQQGALDKMKQYLSSVQRELTEIIPMRFCENETFNLILSFFHTRAQQQGMIVSVTAKLPKELSIPDTELCSVLSNALENALHAVNKVEDAALRRVFVRAGVEQNMLFFEVENAYTGVVKMEGELPVSSEEDHGYGCRSMRSIVERRNGFCLFQADDGIFRLRIVLPLKKKEER